MNKEQAIYEFRKTILERNGKLGPDLATRALRGMKLLGYKTLEDFLFSKDFETFLENDIEVHVLRHESRLCREGEGEVETEGGKENHLLLPVPREGVIENIENLKALQNYVIKHFSKLLKGCEVYKALDLDDIEVRINYNKKEICWIDTHISEAGILAAAGYDVERGTGIPSDRDIKDTYDHICAMVALYEKGVKSEYKVTS